MNSYIIGLCDLLYLYHHILITFLDGIKAIICHRVSGVCPYIRIAAEKLLQRPFRGPRPGN
jgi:hypothetical protein